MTQIISHTNIPTLISKSTYIVGNDLISKLDSLKEFQNLEASKFLVLSDTTVFHLYGKKLLSSLQTYGVEISVSTIPPGEQEKTLKQINSAIIPFLLSGISKQSVLVCMGGGVITDLGGFIGDILLRGIQVVFIPTTLLCQVDASIGGKNGVDVWLPNGYMYKNMLGTISQPTLVISDVDVLSSLPKHELKSGFGEIAKYMIGWGEPSFESILALSKGILASDDLMQLIQICQKIKLDCVKVDPFDRKGKRVALNAGHTFGHAIESVMNGKVSHGTAVGLGLIAMAKLSSVLGITGTNTLNQVKTIIRSLGLPTKLQISHPSDLIPIMDADKKDKTFVLIADIGRLVFKSNIKTEFIMEAIKEILL